MDGWLRYCRRWGHGLSLVGKAGLVRNMRIPKNSKVAGAESKSDLFLGGFSAREFYSLE